MVVCLSGISVPLKHKIPGSWSQCRDPWSVYLQAGGRIKVIPGSLDTPSKLVKSLDCPRQLATMPICPSFSQYTRRLRPTNCKGSVIHYTACQPWTHLQWLSELGG